MASKNSLVLFIAALFGAAVSAQSSVGSSFGFYVYGNGIQGQRLYYRDSDGAAVFTDDATAANMTNSLVPVTLTVTKRQHPPPGLERMAYSFTATPDLESSPAAAGAVMPTNATMFVGQPASNGSDSSSPAARPATHEVGFVLNAEGDPSTPVPPGMRLGGFLIIERRFVYVRDEDHIVYYALFCAFPSKENPAIWTIRWNVTNDVPERANGLPVMLRTAKPPKGSKPDNGWGTKCLIRDF